MPAGPLPYNNTRRLVLKYANGAQRHTTLIRLNNGASVAAAISGLAIVLNGANFCFNDAVSFDGVDYGAAGEDFTTPQAWTPIAGEGGAAPNAFYSPNFVSFIARGSTGRRCRFYWYGGVGYTATDVNYRLSPGESTVWDAFYAAWQSWADTTGVCDIAGEALTWKGYMNLGYNAYYQRKARG